MTREEIDKLWFKAMHDSIKDGEDCTRYHFAALVAAAEREACAKLCDETLRDEYLRQNRPVQDEVMLLAAIADCAAAIRARGESE